MQKKETLTKIRSFTELLFVIYAFIFFIIGLLLLFFTEQISLLTINDEYLKSTIVVQQFFGSFMVLLSFFLFSVRKLEGQVILNFIRALILIGFINLYLLFSLSSYIILPSIYFIFQIIMQLSFFIIFFEHLKRTK